MIVMKLHVVILLCYICWCQQEATRDIQDNTINEPADTLQNDLEEDPLMAPVGEGDATDQTQPDTEADSFAPLPGMHNLIEDSESVLRDGRSKVRLAIEHEQMALKEAGLVKGTDNTSHVADNDDDDDDVRLEKEVEALEHNINNDNNNDNNNNNLPDSIFNTDDFDDDWDDDRGEEIMVGVK